MAHDTAILVSEYQKSGLTQKDFCAEKRIAVSALQYHLGKVRKRTEEDCTIDSPASPRQFIPLQLRQSGSNATTVVIVRGTFCRGELAELLRAVAE